MAASDDPVPVPAASTLPGDPAGAQMRARVAATARPGRRQTGDRAAAEAGRAP